MLTSTVTPNDVFDEVVWQHIDVEAWLRYWAIRMNTDDWDQWGGSRGKNCFLYRVPSTGLWYLMPWDCELTYGNVGAFSIPPITSAYNSSFGEVSRTWPTGMSWFHCASRSGSVSWCSPR